MRRHRLPVLIVFGFVVVACGGFARWEDRPRPILAWPSSPLETRIVFDREAGAETVRAMIGQRITFTSGGREGSLVVAGARREADGRAIVLATDPHPSATRYALAIPGQSEPLVYSLRGVDATWEPSEVGSLAQGWTGWWPHLDPAIVARDAKGSPEHERQLDTLAKPGRLTLRATLDPGMKAGTLRLKTYGVIVEAAAGGTFVEVPEGARAIEIPLETAPTDLFLTIETGLNGASGTLLESTIVREGEAMRIAADRLTVPWAPTPASATDTATPATLPGGLEGGDPSRGRAVFLAEESKCATCHKIGEDGREVGPDLTHPVDRDLAALYRSIADPSARIHPSFVTFTVSTTDGRVLAGIVRADGPDAIRITDTEGKVTDVSRADVVEIQPSGTSIMPVGLAGALGPDRIRDLLAYLASLPPSP